jgi:hypothetical protein
MPMFRDEVALGQRFEFGENWGRFARMVDAQRIAAAERSLTSMLELEHLKGKRFLDIGSGSGLFSLAAWRLGAYVHSFDYDPQSVACTSRLKSQYAPADPNWTIEQGSILDRGYVSSLGAFHVVYAWGVLHHTGAMWTALEHTLSLVGESGKVYLAIYNDQGGASQRWAVVKRAYCRGPSAVRWAVLGSVAGFLTLRSFLIRAVRRQNPIGALRMRSSSTRGMSAFHDLKDWVGGYPFEVARPECVFDFCRARCFALLRLTTAGSGHGCNEYVFERMPAQLTGVVGHGVALGGG